ncbi:hypothetical protein NE237_030322 [Protea cynaroides]|uniref:Lipase-like PAD4 n=1 Tax=Protea cynaroides TaxID=273540 RepID=A0A9Q0GU03_9MAGN|nr:hypothetical protein NE237_030322 [Protea cynaroides]
MEAEMFETSEKLAEFLASTSLLSESWRLCSLANTSVPPCRIIVDQIGDVGYVAFSGVVGVNSDGDNLVPLESDPFGNGPFSSSYSREDGEDPAMVHSWFLHIFLNIFHSPIFHNQMLTVMNRSKAVIVTGHSIGGTTASLAALWLLSYLQTISSPISVLCITFGSPLLGNESLLKAILRERWGGKFCHVVSKDDLVPRLLFAPLTSITPQLNYLLQLWQFSTTSPQLGQPSMQLSEEDKIEFYHYILSHVAEAEREGSMKCPYKPFGSYLLCSEKGAVCVENATAVVQMLHLMFTTSSVNSMIDDHLKYGDVVAKISQQFLKSRSFTEGVLLPGSSYEVGILLALEASDIVNQDSVAERAKECLKMAKQMGRRPNLNCANLANSLAKVNPYRAEIEWYKSQCDESEDQMGYYDSFKLRGASKRISKINMNRFKLAGFWDKVIYLLETNQLPHDFPIQAKWVMGSLFYRLLVEPLDIAEYYRTDMHRIKGHYLMHGRERRYVIFERWWMNRKKGTEDNKNRSKYAGLTQDSCFWARVEEAKDCLENAKIETDTSKLAQLWENMKQFELYASGLIEKKEVSKDVVAKNSSYSLWVEKWRAYQCTRLLLS